MLTKALSYQVCASVTYSLDGYKETGINIHLTAYSSNCVIV